MANPVLVDVKETYENLFNDSHIPMLIISPMNGHILLANSAATVFYGYSKYQLSQLNIKDINQLSAEQVKLEIKQAHELKRNYFIFQHKLADGELRDVEVYSNPIEFEGSMQLFSVIHDITPRVRAEKQLNIYAQLFRSSIDMLTVLDQDHIYLAANQPYLSMLGKSYDEVIGKNAKNVLGKVIYQSYEPYLMKAMQGELIQYERRFITPAGIEMYIETRYFPFFEHSGKQVGVVCVLRDISEKKKTEAQLKLSATVYQSTSEGIVILDEHGHIVDANHAFTQISGYSKSCLTGRAFSTLLHGESESFGSKGHMLNQLNMPWRGELNLQTFNANVLPIAATINKVVNESNTRQRYVCVIRDISYFKHTSEKLKFLAQHDVLTKLPNRLLLIERLNEYIKRAKRQKNLVYVVFIDLDRFKSINDNFGHGVGDAVLASVADRLQKCIRASDIASRVSGDEFVIVIEAEEKPYEILQTLKRLIEIFNSPLQVQQRSLFMTASIGVSQFPADGEEASELISHADTAMYNAKQLGRNQFSFFNTGDAAELKHRIMIENSLRGALQRDEFELFYQPQVTLGEQRCLGFEVLLRWRNNALDNVSPTVFIPMAEQLGLMWDIGLWVLKNACEQGKKWQEEGVLFGKLAVNISGVQLKQCYFYDEIKSILEATRFDSNFLELEITEDFVMNQAEESISQLSELRDLGIDISIDDFGTGYSSMSYLKRLPVNKLKIDRSFITDLETDSDSKIIAKSIIALGQAMHLDIIAEGVENNVQANILSTFGCEQAQGFYYGRPMSKEDVVLWLANNQKRSLDS